MIDIFSEIYKKCKDTALVIIGDGEDRQEVEKYIKTKGMESNIKLLGMRDDVSDFMTAWMFLSYHPDLKGYLLLLLKRRRRGYLAFFPNRLQKRQM